MKLDLLKKESKGRIRHLEVGTKLEIPGKKKNIAKQLNIEMKQRLFSFLSSQNTEIGYKHFPRSFAQL